MPYDDTTRASLSPAVAEVLDAATALAGALADGRADASCLEDFEALHHAEALIAAAKLTALDAIERTEAWRVDGCKAAWSALRARTRMSEADARTHVRMRKQLAALPLVSAAFAAGEVSREHAKVLASALTLLGRHIIGTVWAGRPEWFTAQEAAFLQAARLTDSATLRTELDKRVRALAPEPKARDDAHRHDRRTASITPGYDEMWDLSALLDADGGQLVATAVAAYRRGDHSAGDTRTPAQRTADALVGISRFYLDQAGAQHVRGTAPHLLVIVPEARFAAHQISPGSAGGSGPVFPDPFTQPLFTDRDGLLQPADVIGDLPVPPATYANGQAVPEHVLARYLCDARLTRVVLDAASQPLDVGRTVRLHTHAMWTAAMTQWGFRCARAHCHAPPAQLEMHHPIPWSEGGPTSVVNSVPLCQHDYTRLHEGHLLTLTDGRRLGPHGWLTTPHSGSDEPVPARQQRRQPELLRTPDLRELLDVAAVDTHEIVEPPDPEPSDPEPRRHDNPCEHEADEDLTSYSPLELLTVIPDPRPPTTRTLVDTWWPAAR
ncbi:MAG: DUF222 domain-containing protein [Mycobacteriales bacterium]|nr:DUF222 domain-containing protein [Mycobacteriales bacterium]